MKKLMQKHAGDIQDAVQQDLGKCKTEATFTEVSLVLSEISYLRKYLRKLMRPHKVSTPLAAFPAKSYVKHEPLGVALIIGAWNYPFQLTIAPLIGAIAAGCCAVLKPSDLASNTSQLIAKLLPEYLDTSAFSVIEGGKEETSQLLTVQFDKIFYTGGEHVGKIVMSAASRYLTPVTLELGGKSPCLIDCSADLEVSAKRIVWGKFINAGQTCIAPDYILVDQTIKEAFIEELQKQIEVQYGKEPKSNSDYGRIIDARHCQRLTGYLIDQNVIYGGEIDIQNKFISPTLVLDPSPDSNLMKEEIFGPIMPIIGMTSRQEMLDFVQARPHPLAAYAFAKDKTFQKQFENGVTAGNLCINDITMFMINHNLPFGGVGTSGTGQYHGKYSFTSFCYEKSVMNRSFKFENSLRYAPYSRFKTWLLSKFI
ncbi:MAG: aldehyde dehydrogenase family protein, partial [Pseudomonadota bacterium]